MMLNYHGNEIKLQYSQDTAKSLCLSDSSKMNIQGPQAFKPEIVR